MQDTGASGRALDAGHGWPVAATGSHAVSALVGSWLPGYSIRPLPDPRKKTGQRKQTLPMGTTGSAGPTCRNGRKYLF